MFGDDDDRRVDDKTVCGVLVVVCFLQKMGRNYRYEGWVRDRQGVRPRFAATASGRSDESGVG